MTREDSTFKHVMAATGPVPATELGHVLPHEHVLINQMREYRSTGLINDLELVLSELELFTSHGGQTIVDVTSAELTAGASADPAGQYSGATANGYTLDGSRAPNNVFDLVVLSKRSGVNLILGTGHYRAPYLNETYFDANNVDAIAARIIRDLTVGFPGTDGVRAGIIGEIGADAWHISAQEERSFRAAARASVATGATISTHAARWPVGLAQLDILESEGVAPTMVIVGHSETVHIPQYHYDIAQRGAYVQFDSLRSANDDYLARRADYVCALAEAGYLDRILLSHDVCQTTHQQANGGHGFTLVITKFADTLRGRGFTDAELNQILVENPAAALTAGQRS